ncbi:preprotein translocase subunit SecG [Patescibacteria group bacterium]|nr:preprotein translocase subunit SecG [Patescibacteria group bacterium]
MEFSLSLVQTAVSVLLIASVLLQQRGAALGSAFGGSGGGFSAGRRGVERKLYCVTIALGGIFIGLAILQLII